MNKRPTARRVDCPRDPHHLVCPRHPITWLEGLEARVLLSTYTVTSTADLASTAGNYFGTLRWAVAQANAANAPASSPSVITFSPSVFGTTPQSITLTQGQLELTKGATTLTGPGANLFTVRANNASRVLQVDAGVTATISGLTLANGGAGSGPGGGISNAGTLTVADCALSNNSAASGGGVYNANSLTLLRSTLFQNFATTQGGGVLNSGRLGVADCTLSGNAADAGGGIYNLAAATATVTETTLAGNHTGGLGGGIYNDSATLTVTGSTLSSNSASAGGGIFNSDAASTGNSGTANVTNSTLFSNSATGGVAAGADGGGIYNDASATLTVTDSTLAYNSASLGGGVGNLGAAALNNSLVALNSADRGPDLSALSSSAGGSYSGSFNLIGNGTGQSGLANGSGGNQVGTASAPIDPGLGGLLNNGGPTQTMALLSGSPAIDKGSNSLVPAGVTTDQRGAGWARVVHGTVDIGAYEFGAAPPNPVVVRVTPADLSGQGMAAGIGGGQRSMVSQIQVVFSEPVKLAAGAFTLGLVNNFGSGANNGAPDANASAVLGAPINLHGDGITWVILIVHSSTSANYSYALSNGGASLQDGIYRLGANAADVTAVTGGAAMLSNYTSPLFHRLFGDADGNKTVSASDFARFRATFGSSAGASNFNPLYDSDGNRTINALDYAQFKNRFGMSFTYS